MPFLQVQLCNWLKFVCMPFYNFGLMPVLQVQPDFCVTISTLGLFYKVDLMSVLQVRPYVCFTSSTFFLFYKLDLMPVLEV